MAIEIRRNLGYQSELSNLTAAIPGLEKTEEIITLEKQQLKKINLLLENNDLHSVCKKIYKKEYLNGIDYGELCKIYDTLREFFNSTEKIKEDIDIGIFFDKGNLINIKLLKEEFKQKKLEKKFPNIDFKRLGELFKNPPTELLPQDGSSKEFITYDPFVVRKYLYSIVQMVINEMDLLVGFTGGEGTGKSSACSQDMNLMYYLLKEIKIINYKYNIKELWHSTLSSFIDAEDEHYEERFRIFGLDEGNELNKQDWRDDNVKLFFQRLRRERYNQRIIFVCLPQLGELLTSIVLSRMNFVFTSYTKSKIKTGTLDKGYLSMIIIPRNSYIYSPLQKRNISKEEVIDTLGKILDDKKKYLKPLPSSLIIKKFKKNHVWGFNVDDYRKYMKESNKSFTVTKGLTLSDTECYMLYRSNMTAKKLEVQPKDIRYASLSKIIGKVNSYFENNADLLKKMENAYKRKEERREEQSS